MIVNSRISLEGPFRVNFLPPSIPPNFVHQFDTIDPLNPFGLSRRSYIMPSSILISIHPFFPLLRP